jgi:hypothetical protein
MKDKIFLVLMFVVMIAACDNDEQLSVKTGNALPAVSTVIVSNGEIVHSQTRASDAMGQPALIFKDSESLRSFKQSFENETEEERIKSVEALGVNTLHEMALQADDELEEIGNTATSEEQFRNLYEKYKAKYDGILVSNPLDEHDLTLYVPDGDNVDSYIANTDGIYVVGNQVVKANLKNNISKTVANMSMAFNAPNTTAPTNYSIFKPKKGKRVYLQAYMINIGMWVRMHCEKEMWYGWKNDPNRTYYLVTSLNNITYLGQGKYGQEVPTVPLSMFVFDNHNKVKNGFNIILGKMNGQRITGTLYAWTDITAEYDTNGKMIMITDNGITHPKCLVEKAQIVNVNLTSANP